VNSAALVLTVFVACAVEAVEALTIVLAAGLTRDWRSTFQGLAVALVALAAVVAAVGPALTLFPLGVLRLVVGALLAIFGLMWVRKAILRASGYKGLHDEAGIYERQVAAAREAQTERRFGVRDWYAFTLSFKGVLLEGLEVVFIVITFGDNQGNVGLAALGAAAAVLVIAGIGVAARAPLARVPENTMKFTVGIMLTSFGTFWGAEGAGVHWPGNDAFLLVLIAVYALVCVGYTVLLRRIRAATPVPDPAARPAPLTPSPRGRCPDDPLAPLVRRVLVRLRHRRRLARRRRRGPRPGPHRRAGARGRPERLVAAAGRHDRRPGLVPAPRHQQALTDRPWPFQRTHRPQPADGDTGRPATPSRPGRCAVQRRGAKRFPLGVLTIC
jgi:uncharacterized membrane protein